MSEYKVLRKKNNTWSKLWSGEFKMKWVQKFTSFKSQQKISYGNAKSHWNSEKCLRKVKESIMKQKKLLDTKKSVSEML